MLESAATDRKGAVRVVRGVSAAEATGDEVADADVAAASEPMSVDADVSATEATGDETADADAAGPPEPMGVDAAEGLEGGDPAQAGADEQPEPVRAETVEEKQH